MPLEIRELIIKVHVEKSASEPRELPKEELNDMKQEIIRECTEVILSRIHNLTER